jgi:CRISPR/Cas system CSM-associated protein Csm4 (group 5 of RAMP superfamily)
MPTPIIPSYAPGLHDDINAKIKGLSNAYIETTQYLQWLMQHLDEKNVVRAKSVIASWIYANEINADQINGGTIRGVTIDITTNARVGQNLYLGNQASLTDTKNIYFNDYMYLAAKADSGWVIQFGCGYLEFIGSIRGDWAFSPAYVSGLDVSGWAKTDAIQNWVSTNFVHK